MSTTSGERRAYPHPHVNESWLAKLREDVIDPGLPIVEAHHHLWDRESGRYLLDELRADLTAGHNVRATVFIQCGFAYRSSQIPASDIVVLFSSVRYHGRIPSSGKCRTTTNAIP